MSEAWTQPMNDTCAASVDIPKTSMNPDGALTLTAIAGRVQAINDALPLEEVLTTLQKLEFMQGQIKALKSSLDARLVEYIQANGDIQIGTRRLYVGTKKTTKCVDVQAAVKAILEDCGGDVDMMARCLSSDALKFGASKTVLKPENYDKFFKVTPKTELREGVETPVKQLCETNEAFQR